MNDHYILDENQNIILVDLVTWAKWYEDADRRVAHTKVPELNANVSTVFLGLNHQWGDGPPLLFETMIFGSDLDGYQERYSTWDEAVKGHDQAVKLLQSEGE